MHSTRREFLVHGMGATTLLATGVTMPGFLTRTARSAPAGRDDTILVVVQMTGGNDGLNTVIPFQDDLYHRNRPTLRVDPAAVHSLDGELGLHPDMAAFKQLYDDGQLSVLTNVGYPNPDRSHFRSMDIWHTASLDPDDPENGWLGRVVDQSPATRPAPLAMHIGDSALPTALKAQRQAVPSIRGIDAFRLQDSNIDLEQAIAARREAASDDLLYVQRIAVSSCANARRLEEVAKDDDDAMSYPAYGLANRLRQIAQLIGADFGARVYYTSIGGFDTHARQVLAHGPLLRELAESVAAFQADLDRRRLAQKVVLMTFSEFGRRVKENGSRGTDHGAAAPMFMVGSRCVPGIIGGAPNLAALRDGDVPHEIDFRQVYAAVLDQWLGIDHRTVLGGRFEPVRAIRG